MFKATVELLLDVNTEGEACDAIAEALRPLLVEHGGDCLLDWQHKEGSPHWIRYDPARQQFTDWMPSHLKESDDASH